MSQQFEDLVKQYQNQKGCSWAQALSAMASQNPQSYQDYLKRAQTGKNKPLK